MDRTTRPKLPTVGTVTREDPGFTGVDRTSRPKLPAVGAREEPGFRITRPKLPPEPIPRGEELEPELELVTREELEAVKRDVADLRNAFKRLKSDTEHEMASGFDGMSHQLPAMIEGVVVSKFNLVNAKLDALILKAGEAEKYRAIREEIEKEVATKQGITLDFEIKKTELKAKQIALEDLPKASVFARQRIIWGGISAFILAILGLAAAAIASHPH